MTEYDALIALFEDGVRQAAWTQGVQQASANGTGLLVRPIRTDEAASSLRTAADKAVKDFVTSPRICGPTLETHLYAAGARTPHAEWWLLEYPASAPAPSTLNAEDAYLTPRGVAHAYAEIAADAQT